MTPVKVRAVLGRPRSQKLEGDYGLVWRYADKLEVEFTKRGVGYGNGRFRVSFVTTTSKRDKTPGGLHVGSSLSRVKKLPHIFCGDYGTNRYICSWAVTGSNGPCGPQLYFDFKRAGKQVGDKVIEIESTANNGEGCSGDNAYKP
jgi:hypothetical protein